MRWNCQKGEQQKAAILRDTDLGIRPAGTGFSLCKGWRNNCLVGSGTCKGCEGTQSGVSTPHASQESCA